MKRDMLFFRTHCTVSKRNRTHAGRVHRRAAIVPVHPTGRTNAVVAPLVLGVAAASAPEAGVR